MEHKKKIILSIIALTSIVLITVGVSVAFFNYAKEGTTENSITTDSITFLYTENSKGGKGIKLEDSFPMSDELGKKQQEEGSYFDFKITSKTAMNNAIPYEVTVRKNSESTLEDDSIVKIYLTELTNGIEEEIFLKKFSELEQTEQINGKDYTEKTIYTGKVPSNSSNYEKSFRLRMWIDENADFSEKEDGTSNSGKTFQITVNVYANGKVVDEEEKELESNTELKDIKINATSISKVSGKEWDYEEILEEGTSIANLEIEPTNLNASVKIEKISTLAYNGSSNIQNMNYSNQIELNAGDNYIKITVVSENKKNSKKYTINLRVAEKLVDRIKEDNPIVETPPTLTTTSEETGEKGLYVSTDTNDEQPTYYFRGAVENNYVDFAGFIWRIIRINEDGTIRLISQNLIDSDAGSRFNPNGKSIYYSDSNIENGMQYIINNWYQTYIGNNTTYDNKVALGEYCEQAKVAYNIDNAESSGADMQIYTEYYPNFKCQKDNNGKGPLSLKVGMITYDELIFAGGYNKLSNSSYYLFNNYYYSWTMSPSNYSTSYDWCIGGGGWVEYDCTNGDRRPRPVINLKPQVTVTGHGTATDPFAL